MTPIRIVVADDHAILRAGLRLLIEAESNMVVVGEAETAAETGALVASEQPDVLVLDISMPGGGTLELLSRLQVDQPELRVLILTMHDDESYLRACLGAGAAGYLVKSAADEELLNAIRAINAGRSYIGVSLGPARLRRVVGSGPTNRLSAREREVLQFVAFGMTNQEVADRLGVGVKSIESYRARVNDKLGFRNKHELVRYAVTIGLMSPEKLTDGD